MKIITGDLLSNTSGILVHGCNCKGVMGGGIAAVIRKKYPGVYLSYTEFHRGVGLRLGDVLFSWNPEHPTKEVQKFVQPEGICSQLPRELVVANAMTQFNYGRDPDVVYVDYDAVFAAFARLRGLAKLTGATVRFPMLGAGLANGDWAVIEQQIRAGLGEELFAQSELWVLPGTSVPGHDQGPEQLSL